MSHYDHEVLDEVIRVITDAMYSQYDEPPDIDADVEIDESGLSEEDLSSVLFSLSEEFGVEFGEVGELDTIGDIACHIMAFNE